MVVGAAAYGLSRPDVCNVYAARPGCPNVGYDFSLNTATLGNGTHVLTINATDTDPNPDTGSASIIITVSN
jgi:hypothetical protein